MEAWVLEESTGDSVRQLQGALVDALVAMTILDAPETRRSLIRIMSRNSGGAFAGIPEVPAARAHLVEIALACLSLPTGLQCLIAALRLLDPAHQSIKELERIARSRTILDLVSSEDRVQVVKLLGRLPELNVEPLWYAATDDVAPLPAERTDTLVAAFDQLTTLNIRSDGLPPAIAFVELAACRAPGQLAAQLRTWTEAQAERIGLGTELGELRRSAATNPPPPAVPPPCLVVQIEEHAIRSGHYLLSHWIQRRPGAWHPVRGDVRTVRWDEAEEAVEALVNQAEEAWGDEPGHVALEFVLPIALLNEAVDWWRSGGADTVPFCVDYPVVVRSLERMRDLSRRRVWLNRWTALLKAPSLNVHSALGYTGDPGTWNVQLHRDLALSTVILGEPPQAAQAAHGGHLWMALTAGVPVILWDRRKRSSFEFTQLANELIGDPPMTLAGRVQRLRQTAASLNGAAATDEHPGRHIALLWDDPTRLVDNFGYRALDGDSTTWKSSTNE
jgi:hypothetical protein